MWSGRDSEITTLENARIHEPIQSHEAPTSMGNDGYLHYPDGLNDRDHGANSPDADHISELSLPRETLAGAGARMGGIGTTTANTRRSFVDGEDSGIPAIEEEDHIPGRDGPIGFLAAVGTPYAKKPIWKSKKAGILCATFGLITLIVRRQPLLNSEKLPRHILNVSVLSISTANITSPMNGSFSLTLEGQVHKVAVFPAHITFHNPLEVYWIAPENLTNEIHIGSMPFAPIGVANGHGRIKQLTQFTIRDQAGFGRFAQYLITQDEFTWRLKSNGVSAKAFGFLGVHGNLEFIKDVTLQGIGNFTDISISDFQLPGNDPAGGISLAVVTKLTNPSPFGIGLGILSVDLYYQDVYLGPASTPHETNLTTGVNHIALTGRLVDHTGDAHALALMSTLFSNYLNGIAVPVVARGASVSLPGGEVVAWLKTGIEALVLNVPLQSPTGRISPIQGININTLSLAFDPKAPYAPIANSSDVSASFALPFGFSLNIAELGTTFHIIDNKTAVAGLSAPMGMATTTILTRNAGFTYGTIVLDLPSSPLLIGDSYNQHLAFSQFTTDLTTTNGSTFLLIGSTTAVTDLPIGQVKLTDIGFTVPAGLMGLEALNKFPTTIVSVDVVGGSHDAVILIIKVGLTNPSNIDLRTGNVTFQLFGKGGAFLGTTVLPDLHLVSGYQEQLAVGYFQANSNPVALQTLTDYAQGKDSTLAITGFNGSSACDSLQQAFMAINLTTTLKGLTTKLLQYANVTILPTTGVTNNLANSIVSLDNPFSSDLTITNIQANVTSHGLFLGSIVVATNFAAAGRVATVSPQLAFNINLYPPDIFALLRALVVQSGGDVAQLDGIVALGGYKYTKSNSTANSKRDIIFDPTRDYADLLVSPGKAAIISIGGGVGWESMISPDHDKRGLVKRNIYTGFDLTSYVLNAFKSLTVDVDLVSVLHIGDFTTNLVYAQGNVPAYTDTSLVLLLPILARPIVQKIVDASILSITTVMIANPTDASFQAGLVGAITNAGPFDGIISFPKGLTVAWNGSPLGQIAMPNLTLVADVGVALNLDATFAVSNVNHLGDFTGYLLSEPSFTWQIYGEDLTVQALGISIDGISISKNTVLEGMNGFRNLVRIENFDLPSNSPAGGITLNLQTSLSNPSAVGIALSSIGFQNTFGSTSIGPVASSSAFTLAPKSTISLALSGRLIPQSSQQGLNDLSTIFNGFVHGVPSQLVVHGDSAGPADCTWLNAGIKKLAIGVTLPAAANLQVINSIDLHQLTLSFTQATAFNPAFSTDNTIGAFQLPFAFPIDITNLAAAITASDNGASARRANGDFAILNVPMSPAKTDVVARTILITFQNVPFKSLDNNLFGQFLSQVTTSSSKSFGLGGSANTIASTAAGSINLENVAFTVSTDILGLQGLNAQPTVVSNLDVYHGFPSYLQINANAALFNPSNVTLIISGQTIAFGLRFNGQQIGTAQITDLTLRPGMNIVPTAVHYSPSGGAELAAGQVLLQNYVQGVPSTTIIFGNSGTTSIQSLQSALESIALTTSIPPLNQTLVTGVRLSFPFDIATSGIAQAQVSIANPFTAVLNLLSVVANGTYNNLYLGQVNQNPLKSTITVGGHSNIVSQNLPFNLNIDPKTLIQFIEQAASAAGVDLGILIPQFAYILGLPSTATNVTSAVNPNPETCTPSGTTASVDNSIIAALKGVKVNLLIQSNLKLDDYATGLNFAQNQVPAVFDNSVLYLTGLLGKSLINHIIDQAALTFTAGLVTNITDGGFTVALTGSLLNSGPFDALIEFPTGVDVIWQGNNIATIDLPPLCAAGGVGIPNLQTTGILRIKNQNTFTAFATYLLLNPSFTWTITTSNLRVLALGTIFGNRVLTKDVTFKAFNGLPGVTIINPNFPGDAPNGIQLVTDTAIPSQSNLGVDLGTVTFIASFEGQEVGPIQTTNLNLAPLKTTDATLTGTIIKRTSEASTASLGVLFSQFLAGQNQTLTVVGNDVTSPAQPGSPVTWLSAAFKKLTLQVVLPGHVYEVISAIAIQDLTVSVQTIGEAYAVPVQNNATNIVFKNPFGFSLGVAQAGGSFVIGFGGTDAGVLNIPLHNVVSSGTSTGQPANIVINFPNPEPLTSINNGAFNSFFAAITTTSSVAFTLHGVANVSAITNAGNIPITGLPFSVPSTFPGLNSFNHQAVIPAVPVVIGSGGGSEFSPSAGSDFIRISLGVILIDPAPLILHTNLLSLQIIYNSYVVGRAYLTPLNLYPGSNTFAAEFHYQPADPSSATAQSLLSAYLSTTGSIPLTIQGDTASSPYGSLQQGLSEVTIPTSILGLGVPLIHDLVIYLDATTALCKNYVMIETRINNNLHAPITILSLSGVAYQDGVQFAQFTYHLEHPFVTLPGENPGPYSEMIGPVYLPQQLIGSIELLLRRNEGLTVDITAEALVDGYHVPALVYTQTAVPYSFTFTIHNLQIGPGFLGTIASDPVGSIFDVLVELLQLLDCKNGILELTGILADITLLPALLGELISALPGIFRPAPTTTTINTGFVTGIITQNATAQIAATAAALGTSSAVAASVSQIASAPAAAAPSGSSSRVSAPVAPSVAAPPVVPSSPSRAPVAANPVSTSPATRTLLARDFLTTTTDASAPGPTEPPNLLLSHERLSVAAKQLGMEAWQLQHILFKHGFTHAQELDEYRRNRDQAFLEERERKRLVRESK